ncbi:hypothetical protein OS493_018445 [Desmophyllum pertusum]|uniref:BAG domain-containing protein n=1 Tax=Desmophyllum pertusum TaxID=174260 RepID=A0A9X0A0U3_9CNID|nr:hypothetical protein OS493_018445 [Desmophyllum pertusum]
MASGGNDRDRSDRVPQFTSSNYEIPSWQIEWNKPWYQHFEGKGNAQSKYNSRGHVLNCKCSLCEEDMETAFSPQPMASDVTHLFNLSKDQSSQEAFPSKEKQENPPNQTKERVILFSDLPEVTPPSTSTASPSEGRTNASSTTGSNFSGAFETLSDVDTDALFDGIGSISAIQSISDRVTDLQTQVNHFSGAKDSREFIVLRGLLVATLGELNRIDTVGIRWLRQAKNIAMESIHDLLTQLKSKINEDDEY